MNGTVRGMRLLQSFGVAAALFTLSACGSKSPPVADGGSLPTEDAGMVVSDGGTQCSQTQLEALESQIGSVLDSASMDASVSTQPEYTLRLERADGRIFTHSQGASTATTRYESASTSKWVTAAVILRLVDEGKLSLDSPAKDFIPFWVDSTVTLRHLLSFRSGYDSEASLCINGLGPKKDNFLNCTQDLYDLNVATAKAAGSEFHYSSSHMQFAGLMAINASSSSGWTSVFDEFKAKTGLFPTSVYNKPSELNPRLAGGMTWTGAEYHDFLRALYKGTILKAETRAQLFGNQRGSAVVDQSPLIDAFNEDWAYGLGNWLECPTAIGPDTFNCGEGHRNSSPGAYGAYPFIDFDHQYFGILARQGALATFREGLKQFRTVETLARKWAHNDCSP